MNIKEYFTYKKIIQSFLVIMLGVFCYAFAGNVVSIDDDIIPLSSGNIEAMFYIEDPESGSVTCIGDGLINTTNPIINDSVIVSNHIISSPTYSSIIGNDLDISWNSIQLNDEEYQVIGTIFDLNKSPNDAFPHEWADTSTFLNQASIIENSIHTSKTLYFASDGNDNNSGLDSSHPKKTPTDYLRNGDCTLLFKSGDIIYTKYNLVIGTNTIISTYGGSERATISSVTNNSNPFSIYDINNNIYAAKIDSLTKLHYNVAWIKLQDSSTINWHKVFSYDELKNDNDFYSDELNQTIYLKSSSDITNKSFEFSSAAGGLYAKDGANLLCENIELVGGVFGINITHWDNLVLKNCFVHYIGGRVAYRANGSPYRYGNGIQIWADNTQNIYVYNNIVSDCFDAGITPQITGTHTAPSTNIFIFDNYIDNCMYCIECFQQGNSASLSNVHVDNNILSRANDITSGYRYASNNYSALICLWDSKDSDSCFYINNNFGIDTSEHAYSFYNVSPEGVYNFSDNTMIVSNKSTVNSAIKNIQFYSGDTDDIMLLDADEPLYKDYYEFYLENTANYDESSNYE